MIPQREHSNIVSTMMAISVQYYVRSVGTWRLLPRSVLRHVHMCMGVYTRPSQSEHPPRMEQYRLHQVHKTISTAEFDFLVNQLSPISTCLRTYLGNIKREGRREGDRGRHLFLPLRYFPCCGIFPKFKTSTQLQLFTNALFCYERTYSGTRVCI